MDIEKLWEILYKERNTSSLQELPANFCEEVGNYIRRLEEEKRAMDDTRKELVEDEIKNVRMKVEDIIRRRIGKIVKVASSGTKTQPKGMIEEEKRIFEGVMAHVKEGRKRINELILGEKEEGEGESKKRDEEKEKDQGGKTNFAKKRNEELHTVRILEDIPTFMGTDGRIYKVRKEDVIMLPKTNAEILCKRGMAMEFESFSKEKNTTKNRLSKEEK